MHANGQSAHFKLKKKKNDKKNFLKSINFFLNNYSVSVLSLKKRSNSFHARHSAKNRVATRKIGMRDIS